jgi:hypothetical protein
MSSSTHFPAPAFQLESKPNRNNQDLFTPVIWIVFVKPDAK